MNRYINNLYNGHTFPAEQIRPSTEAYGIILDNISSLHKSFESQLTPQLKEAFETLLQEQNKCFSMELQETFTSGFKLGANLLVEILVNPSAED